MSQNNFNLYSKYYDLLYQGKDYTAEVNYINSLLEKYAAANTSILEFGSGTGGHGLILQQKGFTMFGLERSEDMVREAQANGYPCMQADITDFDLGRKFGVVLSMFHVVSYLTSNEALIKTFQNAQQHLEDGGIFIFDLWYSPAVYHQKPESRIKRVSNESIDVIRFASPVIRNDKNVVDVNYTVIVKDKQTGEVIEIDEVHPMRHFSLPEIELLGRLTGFELIKAEELITANEPSEHTWGVNFIMKKI